MNDRLNRREFAKTAAAATAATVIGVGGASAKQYDTGKILNYNENMEYRRLGKTGIMISAVGLGGHWKRLGTVLGKGFVGAGWMDEDFHNVNDSVFMGNRNEIVSRCIDAGINFLDTAAPPEVLAYAKALKGRRDKMYFGYSWPTRESRFEEYQKAGPLLRGLEEGMKEANLDYVDLWRITLPMNRRMSLSALKRIEEGAATALETARKQGKVRFTGVATHTRAWLASLIKRHPNAIQVVLFPYTAASKRLLKDSLFDVIQKHDVGVLGIKPFADNSLFVGTGALDDPNRENDDLRARMAIRYILNNPVITAPIPGLINTHQLDNVVKAIQERRELNSQEMTELEGFGNHMWANLRPQHRWLRDWEYV